MGMFLGSQRNKDRGWMVGLDFGTTFSAVALCFLGEENVHCKPGQINPVKLYPQAGSAGSMFRKYREVPSDLRYEDRLTRWGYGVQAILDEARVVPGHRISRFKLLLDESSSTLELRHEVEDVLSTIPGGKTGEEVICDYLTELLEHIQRYLQDYCGYRNEDHVELVCTVPAIWTQSAIRKMIAATEEAQRRADFGSGQDVEDVYLVSEPEAAAAHVLAHHPNLKLQKGDTFTLCDAGGGTVDLITYTVEKNDPWRLAEAVRGQGAPCGSSFVNLAFEKQLKERLKHETYLNEDDGQSMQEKIDAAVLTFEKMIKPDFGLFDDQSSTRVITIAGLKPDEKRGFARNQIWITHAHLVEVFRPVVDKIWDLISSQIQEAQRHSLNPKLLLLVGGFAGSPFLRRHIIDMCQSEAPGLPAALIRVVTPDNPEFAIASGAICRAMDKNNGPTRKSRSSVGISLHMHPIKNFPPHKDAKQWEDETDGQTYVRDCLDWLIRADDVLPPTGLKVDREYHHTISVEDSTCFLTTRVYVLDRAAASFYPMSHPENEGCELSEEFCFEFTAEQLAHLKEVLPRKPKKVRKRRSGRKPTQIATQPLRRSSRNRLKQNGKSRRPQNYGLDQDNPIILESPPDEQLSPQNEDSPIHEVSSQLQELQAAQEDTHAIEMDLQTSKFRELAVHESDSQLQDADEMKQEYIQIDYKLIMEVNGLRLDYQIECTVGEVTHRAMKKFNLAKIFEPGTA